MRIIAGKWAGRTIDAPPGLTTRPITDRIKQALFDWLGDLQGVRMADVCSGSGAIAFEAASRGAAEIHAIESDRSALTVLRANAERLRATQVRVHGLGFERVLPTLSQLDLVFADPPFPWYAEAPERLTLIGTLARAAVTPQGNLLIRGEDGAIVPEMPGWREAERRQWGGSWTSWLHATP